MRNEKLRDKIGGITAIPHDNEIEVDGHIKM